MFLIFGGVAVIFVKCRMPIRGKKKQDNMNIIGAWQKKDRSNCNEKYPEKIVFAENGIYKGEASGDSMLHPIWDVGTFEIIKEGTVRISTSNDAYITYPVTLRDGMLSFTDPDGCLIEYRPDK